MISTYAQGGDSGDVWRAGLTSAAASYISSSVGKYYGNTYSLERVFVSGVAGGVVSELQGQPFARGFAIGAITALARYGYNEVVRYDTTWAPGGDAVNKGPLDLPAKGANNIGFFMEKVDPNSLGGEGGVVSRMLNYVPGVNAVARLHDVFQVRLDQLGGEWARNLLNVPGMVPAVVITYAGLVNTTPSIVDSLRVKKAK